MSLCPVYGKSNFSQGFSSFLRWSLDSVSGWFIVLDIEKIPAEPDQNRVRKHPRRLGGMVSLLSVLINNFVEGRANALEKSGWLFCWKENSSQRSSSGVITKEAQIFPLSRVRPPSTQTSAPFLALGGALCLSVCAVCAVTQGNHALLTGFFDPFPF